MEDYSMLIKMIDNLVGKQVAFSDSVTLGQASKAIEDLIAQLSDKDYLIQQQTEEIQRLQRDVKKQQEKMIELAKVYQGNTAELEYYKKRFCEFCGIAHNGDANPDNCEIAGHGVWVARSDAPLNYYKSCDCSICGHNRVFKPDEVPKFCENCGVKMAPVIVERKEEKE